MDSSTIYTYKEKPNIYIKRVWLMTSVIGYICGCVFLSLIILASIFLNWAHLIVQISIILIIVLLILLVVEIIYIQKYKYKLYSFEINERNINIQKRGWLYTNIKTIPIEKVYYIDIYKGPILNKYNLCTLKIGTIAHVHDIEGIKLSEVNKYKYLIYKENT